jgi:hypothetical protein
MTKGESQMRNRYGDGKREAASRSNAADQAVSIPTALEPHGAAWNEPFQARLRRWSMVIAGIVVGQFILYGPSLVGTKVLLPLDLLAGRGMYLPQTPLFDAIEAKDPVLADLICTAEPARQFGAKELSQGRLPLWVPYHYAGAPFVFPIYSPFWLAKFAVASPVVVAWVQMLLALVAGCGMYAYCRRVLQVAFWPAAVVAWCYPMTGFFVLWQGYPLTYAVAWLPWILLAVDDVIRRRGGWGASGMALATCLVLVSGQLDLAGQVLLTSGIYAAWCFIDVFGRRLLSWPALTALARVCAAWGLGFFMASPYLLPLLEYTRTGSRMMRRSAGAEERPPYGLAALPQTVLPDMYGTSQAGSLRIAGDANQLESSAAAYVGLVTALLAAPLGWCSRRHRSINVFWLVLSILSLGWSLDVPVLVPLLRLPLLNMMSHNRFVFAASFAVLSMAAVGIDVLQRRGAARRSWFAVPLVVLAALCAWCVYHSFHLPEPLASILRNDVVSGKEVAQIHDVDGVLRVQSWFRRCYAAAAMISALGACGWLALAFSASTSPRCGYALGALVIGELLWFGYGRNPQCDPALYYPRIPALQAVANLPPGRMIGVNCLPANLAWTHGLCDVRGYDGVDPASFVALLMAGADKRSPQLPYALTQWLLPQVLFGRGGAVRLHPVLDMLGVRYVVFRGSPPAYAKADIAADDYWVVTNPSALPRAFVPRRVEVEADEKKRRARLADPTFNPREVAYVESALELAGDCRGSAAIVDEVPTRITVELDMQSEGMVVLSDLWHPGWVARLEGTQVPILRANHAVRGVVAPPGRCTLVFTYEPASFRFGIWLAACAAILLVAWQAMILRRSRK